jgi:hypothetical protein
LSCGGILFGTAILLTGILAIYTGRMSSGQAGVKPVLRDDRPALFWTGVVLTIVIGILVIIIFGFVILPHPHR